MYSSLFCKNLKVCKVFNFLESIQVDCQFSNFFLQYIQVLVENSWSMLWNIFGKLFKSYLKN